MFRVSGLSNSSGTLHYNPFLVHLSRDHPVSSYAYCSPQTSTPVDDLREPELLKLTAEIESGNITTVALAKRRLWNNQLVKIVSACNERDARVVEIDVSNNQIGSGAIRILIPILRENTSTKILDLTHNEITDEGIECFIRILEQNFTLIHINLSQNPVSASALSKLLSFLRRNMEIQQELNKSKFYFIIKTVTIRHLINNLVDIVLDYFNEAEIPDARDVVARIFYPTILPQNKVEKLKALDADNAALSKLVAKMQKINEQSKESEDAPAPDKAIMSVPIQDTLRFSQKKDSTGKTTKTPVATLPTSELNRGYPIPNSEHCNIM